MFNKRVNEFSAYEISIINKYYSDIEEAIDFAAKTIPKMSANNCFEGVSLPEFDLIYLPESSKCRVSLTFEFYTERYLDYYFRGWDGKRDRYGNSGTIYVDFPCEHKSDIMLFVQKLAEDYKYCDGGCSDQKSERVRLYMKLWELF